MSRLLAIGTVAAACLSAAPPGADERVRTLFVAADSVGAADGSADRPFRTIQEAVRAANDGDTIAVAEGRYDEGSVDVRHKALTLLGGFRRQPGGRFATRDWLAAPSTVVGRHETGDGGQDPSAVFIVGDSAGARIDGFTITGGRHGIFAQYSASTAPLVIANNVIEDNGTDAPLYYEYGGGIHSEYKSLVVENNLIRRNASGRGAGIAALGAGSARIEANVIEGNVALGDHGGGIYVQQPSVVRGNIIRANSVTAEIVNWMGGVGGGITIVAADARLSENVIVDNYAKKCGAGVFVDEGATATLERDLVVRNRAVHPDGWGGSGIYVDGGSEKTTTVRIDRSVVIDNARDGPGVGNGVFVASRSVVTIEHSIIGNNGTRTDLEIVDDSGTSALAASRSIVGAGRTPRGRH
ncbi:MAG TPA: right-handed parallel beta-helix repeat-containing protein [Vicinamibacterales bacterium]|nr:right-handed parallel beta-helix repeat-containing protein [Vicinamibacterales bacterium]